MKAITKLEISFKENRPKALMTMQEDTWAEVWRSTDVEMDFYASLPFAKFISVANYPAMFGIKIDNLLVMDLLKITLCPVK